MEPEYHNMQLLMIDKHNKSYNQGDVIAIKCSNLSAIIIKRIVACPGDKVIISNKTLYINDDLSNLYPENNFEYAGILKNELSLYKDEYVVIGDNIEKSKDSRYTDVGIIKKSDIIGKVIR